MILAGGLARRMGGGDKALRPLAGRPLIAHVIARLGPQVGALALNANGDPARFAAFGLPVLADPVEGFAGPLAGILAGIEWAAARAPSARWVVSAPCDSPFLPDDLVARLEAAVRAEGAGLAAAASAGRTHPVVGLWPVALGPRLRRALIEEGVRKIDAFTAPFRLAIAGFAAAPVDPFFNANREEDLAEAGRLAALLRRSG